MGETKQQQRLDQILVREGIISEEQIKEALIRQKAHGGKLGSQLLYHRYIDEAGLVKALALQFGREGVILADLEIPEIITGFIPAKVAIARRVLPFDFNPEANVLKVACEDPTDESLINELNFLARGKTVKLYVAAELALNTAIAKYYQGRDISLDDNLLLEIPDEATDTGKVSTASSDSVAQEPTLSRGAVLLVTDEEYSGPVMQSLLERDGYQVVIVNSADDAIDMIGDRAFHTVLIKDTVAGDYIDLIDRLRKASPRTVVRYYESASSLLIKQDTITNEGDLLLKNLELFTSLLSLKEKMPTNHGGAVGHYVEKLCRQLGLPVKERLLIANAGYLHDLARYYYRINEDHDHRSVTKLTAKLMTSLNYSPVVAGIVRSMYIDLGGRYTKRLPIEALGGNILTVVDLYCQTVDPNDKLSLDKFDAIKKKYRDLIGRLFLSEVAEAFMALIQDEILQSQTVETTSQVMIYADNAGTVYPVENRLKNEGFRTVAQCTVESFAELYGRSEPDMMILLLHGDRAGITAKVDRLANVGADFRKVPTFLLVDGTPTSELTPLLDRGVEDIIALDVNLDLLFTRMRKIQSQSQDRDKAAGQSTEPSCGTHGRLSDMNLIDLLQALCPSRKTVRITISAGGSQGKTLLMYLNQGDIIFARVGDVTGAEAVYEGMAWTDGSWAVQPVSTGELPEPNNRLPNDSILIEGRRLLDEKVRSSHLL